MDVDVGERHVAGELEAHHHHAGHPQEQDVAGRRKDVGGVEGAQLGRVVGPAERRERPQRGAEPGVEHVGVAVPAVALRRVDADVDLAVAAVPDRDLVAPPQLAADAPRADVLQPLDVAARLRLGVDAHPAVAHDLDGRRGQLVHAHEPLQRDQRLDPLARAMAVGHLVPVGLAVAEPALGLEVGHHALARLEHRQARVGRPGLGRHAAVLADHRHLVEVVAAADLEVVGVVARGDLQRAGAELGLDVVVGHDRQGSSPGAPSRRSASPTPTRAGSRSCTACPATRAARPRGRRSPSACRGPS